MGTLLAGLSFGLAAGISPGPLLTLVITTTLERGLWAGIRIAVAPILTDAPVIALSLFVLDRLGDGFLRGLAVVGGVFILYLGVKTVREAGRLTGEVSAGSGATDLWRGFLVNLLSPHPWLFWASVGGPILLEAGRRSAAEAAGFIVAFFSLIVGTKIFLAAIVHRGRRLLGSRGYRIAVVLSGLLLVLLGSILLAQGVAGEL